MVNQLKDELFTDRWKAIFASALILLIAWSYAPFAYVVGISGNHFDTNMGWLFIYEVCIGLSVTLIVYGHFKSLLSCLPSVLSMVTVLLAFNKLPIVMGLLLLLPVFLLLSQTPWLEFNSWYGLITFGLLVALSIGSVCAYNSLHFISWEIVFFLLPVMASCWYFMAPFFLEKQSLYFPILTVLALNLIAFIFTRTLRWQLFVATFLVVSFWLLILFNRHRRPSFILFSLAQMLVIVLIYWS
ncbi:hypothetical protein [Limosilactobacillus secaliphilus]|uniref:Uncharacterized protein n=1 Tax=Limosilactobacillus secaliphilus TaxID=396268 RepID=A0A0R2IB87_9LACO|nr:hypothetical protein [Limosilactobacillus secaliphilus]KRN59204.1 hypothetical protein IV45_GL000243 [Limosilactobacillus secaliphilus]